MLLKRKRTDESSDEVQIVEKPQQKRASDLLGARQAVSASASTSTKALTNLPSTFVQALATPFPALKNRQANDNSNEASNEIPLELFPGEVAKKVHDLDDFYVVDSMSLLSTFLRPSAGASQGREADDEMENAINTSQSAQNTAALMPSQREAVSSLNAFLSELNLDKAPLDRERFLEILSPLVESSSLSQLTIAFVEISEVCSNPVLLHAVIDAAQFNNLLPLVAEAFVESVIVPIVASLTSPAPRPLFAAFLAILKQQPKPVIQTILLSVFSLPKMNVAQFDVCNSLLKELNSPASFPVTPLDAAEFLVGDVFPKLLSSNVDWTDLHCDILLSLLGVIGQKAGSVLPLCLEPITRQINAVDPLTRSVKFGSFLLQLLSKSEITISSSKNDTRLRDLASAMDRLTSVTGKRAVQKLRSFLD